jgi:hypothetical protein
MTDPWTNAGPHFGHPNKKTDRVHFASNSWWNSERGEMRNNNENAGGLYERAAAASSSGDDSRFRRLAARFSRLFDW